jgi:hypothetical protein
MFGVLGVWWCVAERDKYVNCVCVLLGISPESD